MLFHFIVSNIREVLPLSMGGGTEGMRAFELSNTNCDCTGMGPAKWLGRHIWDIRVTSITKSALQVRTNMLSISSLSKASYTKS